MLERERTTELKGVSPEVLRRVFDGRESDMETVIAAEGQMMRCFIRAEGFPSKAVFFDAWVLCIARFVPSIVLRKVVGRHYQAILDHIESLTRMGQEVQRIF